MNYYNSVYNNDLLYFTSLKKSGIVIPKKFIYNLLISPVYLHSINTNFLKEIINEYIFEDTELDNIFIYIRTFYFENIKTKTAEQLEYIINIFHILPRCNTIEYKKTNDIIFDYKYAIVKERLDREQKEKEKIEREKQEKIEKIEREKQIEQDRLDKIRQLEEIENDKKERILWEQEKKRILKEKKERKETEKKVSIKIK